MMLLVGLGNPGTTYQFHRHNIGFMAVDAVHMRHHFSNWRSKFQALVAEGSIDGKKTLLVKPQTFMNLSGQSVGECLRFYKLSLDDLLVIHDELDLPPTRVRIKRGGGSGGHNGVKSIDAHCGSDYRRLRLGIGHPGAKELVHHHVLSNFSQSDAQWLTPLLEIVAEHADLLRHRQDSRFMNKFTLAFESQKQENEHHGF